MKVLFITDKYPFPKHKDGTSLIVGNIIENFSKAHKIHLLITAKTGESNSFEYDYFTKCMDTKKNNYKKKFIKKINNNFFILPTILFDRFYEEFIDISQYDAVVIFGFSNILLTNNLINKYNTPIIFFEIDSISLKYLRKSKNNNIFKKIYYYLQYKLVLALEKEMISEVNSTIYVSDVDLNFMKSNIKNENLYFIPNGVDVSTTRSENYEFSNQSVNLCFSGNLNYGPNYEAVEFILKKLAPKLFSDFDNLNIHIVGRKPDKNWYKNKNVKNGKITITGFVEDIEKYLSKMDIYICPLFNGAGIKNKILQAMAIGLPIISTKLSIDGINELISNKNIHICSSDVEEWSLALKDYISNIDKLNRISAEYKEIVKKNYCWSRVANDLLEIIKGA